MISIEGAIKLFFYENPLIFFIFFLILSKILNKIKKKKKAKHNVK